MSLIQDSIATMGSPTAKGSSKSKNAKKPQTSVGLWTSFKDWWGVPYALQKPTEKSMKLARFAKCRQLHIQIEYDLFRAVLSSDVYIHPVDSGLDPPSAASPEKHPIEARFIDTNLPSAKIPGSVFIHELEITNSTDTSVPQRHLVVIHGYMAAMGYFLKNVEQLAKGYPNLVVHVIDLPGFGNSARPTFPRELLKLPAHATKADEINQIIGVENWFIDKLEEWRIQKKIDHLDLVGHSMGAYLSSCYLLKYNNDSKKKVVDKFVLVSPMGTESSDISLINDSKLQFNHHDIASNPLEEIFASQDFEASEGKNEELARLWEKLGKPKFPRNVVLRTLWNNNVSPFQLLQAFGPFYSKLLSFWSFQRFQNLSSNDEEAGSDQNISLILKLHEYSFSIFNQYQASGELAITKLINHEIVPRIPLCDRGFVEYLNDAKIDTLWMYGDKDWMNTKGGEYCVEKLKKLNHTGVALDIIKDAGHHIYLDNPEAFNKDVKKFLGYNAASA